MTTSDSLDRRLADWLGEDAEFRVPDHLAEVLMQTRATRQRPAWSSLERWLPVDLTISRLPFRSQLPVRLVTVALLLIALVAAVLLAAGSHKSVPNPFGPARNGVFVASRQGVIYRLDPASGGRAELVSSSGFDFGAVWSHDGTQFAFFRAAGRPAPTGPRAIGVMVANADGTNVHEVLQPTGDLNPISWSPDSRQLLVQVVADGGSTTTQIIDVATGKSTPFPVTKNVDTPSWLAPDGHEIIFRSADASPSIRAIHPDGTGLRTLSTHAAADQYDFSAPIGAPDGKSVAYLHWDEATQRQSIVVLDLASGSERALPAPDGINVLGASYAPDGKSLVFTGLDPSTQLLWIYVAPVDGSSSGTRIGQPTGASGALEGVFTPDGKALVVRNGTDDASTYSLYPIDGSQPTQLDSGSYDFIDIQRLAP